MNFVPLIFTKLKDVNVIFLFGNILNTSKHKDIFLILEH